MFSQLAWLEEYLPHAHLGGEAVARSAVDKYFFCGHDTYLSFFLPGPPDPVEVLGNEGVPKPEIM